MTCLTKHLEGEECIKCGRADQVYLGHGEVRFCAYCTLSWDPYELINGKVLFAQKSVVLGDQVVDGELPEDIVERMGLLAGNLYNVLAFDRRLEAMMAIPEDLFTEEEILKRFKHTPGGRPHDQATHNPYGRRGVRGGRVDKASRVWQGKQMEWEGDKLSKLQTGELGEQIAMQALEDVYGVPFDTLNVGVNNAPIDVFGNHQAIEVKTGLASNSRGSHRWRSTIGEPGKIEKTMMKALLAEMSPADKRAYNKRKNQVILDRKHNMVNQMTEESGEVISGRMVGLIMQPDGHKADVFVVDGFHLSLTWRRAAIESNYVGTYEVSKSTLEAM